MIVCIDDASYPLVYPSCVSSALLRTYHVHCILQELKSMIPDTPDFVGEANSAIYSQMFTEIHEEDIYGSPKGKIHIKYYE